MASLCPCLSEYIIGAAVEQTIELIACIACRSYADTRWDSFISAVHALAGDQTTAELARARDHLTELADQGDADAAEALTEPDVQDSHWNAIYSFLEDVAASQVMRRGEYGTVRHCSFGLLSTIKAHLQPTVTLVQLSTAAWGGCATVPTLLPCTCSERLQPLFPGSLSLSRVGRAGKPSSAQWTARPRK